MCSRVLFAFVFLGALAGRIATAQMSGPPVVAASGSHEAGIVSVRMEDMLDAEPVKGTPFCATVVTEHTQTFADGNRIHTSDSSDLCRDSEGRTRRESNINLLGAAPQPPLRKLITIVDPVAGFRYMLDSENKIAHRFAISSFAGKPGMKGEVALYQHVGTAGPNMVVNSGNVFFKSAGQLANEPSPTTKNLGDQMIDGIHATGTSMTTTIPAGKMGNEQPILVTSERWHSPELKAMVMTKHNDPWAGELKTQLTNVNTSEPDSSLFSVPSDYKLVDEKAGPFTFQKRVLAPPAPPE